MAYKELCVGINPCSPVRLEVRTYPQRLSVHVPKPTPIPIPPNVRIADIHVNLLQQRVLMVFEVRHWITNHEAGINEMGPGRDVNTVGTIFYGSKGYLAVTDEDHATYYSFLGKEQQPV
jgi:hypothetical protein